MNGLIKALQNDGYHPCVGCKWHQHCYEHELACKAYSAHTVQKAGTAHASKLPRVPTMSVSEAEHERQSMV